MKGIVLLGIFIFALFVVSCSPSESSINTALAQTLAANPTNTLVPTDTLEPSPTFISTATPTDTPTPSSTPSPTLTPTPTPDIRIIAETSDKFLIQASDLPKEAKYYLPDSSWISPHHNSEIISGWGREEGLDYLEKSGRVDGWLANYVRGTRTVRAPEQLYHNIIQYKSAEGAQYTVKKFNLSTRSDNDWNEIDEEVKLGELSLALIYKEMQPSGKYRIFICIYTTYRNYVSRVIGMGLENDITLDYMKDIAQIVLDKLESAELSEPNWPEE